MSYRRKTQHDSVVPIQQKERERGKSIDENSINVFALLIGGTASVERALVQSPKSISVVNIHGSIEIAFTLSATSSTSGDDFIMFNAIPVPAKSVLFLEGDEIALISKPSEGYNYTFLITAASGTPGAHIHVRT